MSLFSAMRLAVDNYVGTETNLGRASLGKGLRSKFTKRLIAVLSWEEWLYEHTVLGL
jgi:hypothetical protein